MAQVKSALYRRLVIGLHDAAIAVLAHQRYVCAQGEVGIRRGGRVLTISGHQGAGNDQHCQRCGRAQDCSHDSLRRTTNAGSTAVHNKWGWECLLMDLLLGLNYSQNSDETRLTPRANRIKRKRLVSLYIRNPYASFSAKPSE